MKKKEPWYKKYTYSRGEVLYRLAWFVVLVFIFFNYRNLIVAATVNGEPISRLSVVQELEKQQGSAVLDNMINEQIIKQAARERNILVAEEEVLQRIGNIETDLEAQGQTLEGVLTLQGMTRENLEDQVEIQLLVEKILEGDIEITDEEVSQYIEDNRDFLPEDLNEEELRAEALDQIRQQRLSQEFQTWLQDQRDAAEIDILVNY